ncbi:MAG: universal stress protein [Dehalococcoidia bacterium]
MAQEIAQVAQGALVALDGSAVAEQSLPWAKALARDAGGRLLLVKIVPAEHATPEHAQAERDAAQHYLDGVVDDLRGAGVEVSGRAEAGSRNVADGIIACARERSVALIVMSTHGRTGVRRMVLGSVAGEVIEKATSNVLVVRASAEGEREHDRTVRRILLPVDGSPRSEQALAVALEFVKIFNATLEIVQVAPLSAMLFAGAAEAYVPEGLDARLEEAAEDYLTEMRKRVPAETKVEAYVLRGSAADCILDHAAESKADLIVMTTHGRTGMSRWALGSVADRVLRGGTLPVLLVRPTN